MRLAVDSSSEHDRATSGFTEDGFGCGDPSDSEPLLV